MCLRPCKQYIHLQVWSWGSGKFGCLGLGDDENRWFPTRIPLFAESQPATVETVSAGKWHVLCLTQKKNEVYAWGRNNWGQVSKGVLGSKPISFLRRVLHCCNHGQMQSMLLDGCKLSKFQFVF